jgi:UDPglucose 6-dehydrogenase
VYDPAVRKLPPEFDAVTIAQDAPGAIAGAAAVVLATEWPEFRELRAEDFTVGMEGRLVLDPASFLPTAVREDPALTILSIGRHA